MSGAVVSLPVAKQVVPEHCGALKDKKKQLMAEQRVFVEIINVIKRLPFGATLLHPHLGTL